MDSVDADELIEQVRKRPQLWDRGNRLHSNRHVLDKCWKKIAAELNADENKIRRKWKYLRDQFSVEYGKIPPTSCKLDSYEPKWRYYKPLQFLEEVVTPRVNTKNPRREGDSEDHSSAPDSPPPVQKAKRFDQDTKKHKRSRERKRACSDSVNEEHLHFFKSLLPHVRSIPPHLQLSFRNRVQAVVEEFAYRSEPGKEPYFITCAPDHTAKFEPPDPVDDFQDHADEDSL